MTRIGFIRSAVQNARHPHRFDVAMVGPYSDERRWISLYAMDPAIADLCERAGVVHRAVTLETTPTPFGERITAAALVPEQSSEVA